MEIKEKEKRFLLRLKGKDHYYNLKDILRELKLLKYELF